MTDERLPYDMAIAYGEALLATAVALGERAQQMIAEAERARDRALDGLPPLADVAQTLTRKAFIKTNWPSTDS